ncbi:MULTISPECIES: toxin-activating lysine-acyltransferase [unclassified Mesorhizobium]|uniref:toxin-activating lysine-acyltransferase n=1 Tax=unclassified Mesorhizobium TaxID=325217 RepID=UPI00301577B0
MTTKKSEKKSHAMVGSDKGPVPIDPVAGKSVAEIFGEVVWLMSQDKEARELSIKDLEWLVMPPILLRQFHIKYVPVPSGLTANGERVRSSANNRKSAFQPISAELFAMCSDSVAERLSSNDRVNLRLSTQDWRSGTKKIPVLTVTLMEKK